MMNYGLEMDHIYDTLQDVANAIASVLKVDVMIVDRYYRRIVVTGVDYDYKGTLIDRNSVFAHALRTGEHYIIEDPRDNEICQLCESRSTCKEYAEVCCPIKVDNEIAGIIGLIAFNKEQQMKLLGDKVNLLEFLGRMANLIGSKIIENRKTIELNRLAIELETLLDTIGRGVISTNAAGDVLRYNKHSARMFRLGEGDVFNIQDLIGVSKLNQVIKSKKTLKNVGFRYKNDVGIKRGYFDTEQILINGEVAGYVFSFEKIKAVINVVNSVISSNYDMNFDDIVGESPLIVEAKAKALKAAEGRSTILILGESGTGKELFARSIHSHSDRKEKAFVPINCAAIPEQLLESELFGYEEGAFSGAKKGGKIGKFEIANRGTLFLDEIGDMSLHLQAKLLRVLQEMVVDRVGGVSGVAVDVRIIAATNQDLEKKVKNGEFREDLYYRLNVIPIHIPALRERTTDVRLLAAHFLALKNEKLEKKIKGFEKKVTQVFEHYKWTGNVRELENTVEYAVNMASTETIGLVDLPVRISQEIDEQEASSCTLMKLDDMEAKMISEAVSLYGKGKEGIENITEVLGISRATLYRKMKKYNL